MVDRGSSFSDAKVPISICGSGPVRFYRREFGKERWGGRNRERDKHCTLSVLTDEK